MKGTSTAKTVLRAEAIVTPTSVLRPGWLELEGDTITFVGRGEPARPADLDLGPAVVVPGFVDMHVHGGGGAAFGADLDQARTAVAFHRTHGTTTMLASLVTAAPDVLLRQVSALAELTGQGEIAGTHLEGPWLSRARCGAHDPDLLRDPHLDELRGLLRAGGGTIRMITIAPELVGAIDAVEAIADSGVVAAVGHTEATYEQTLNAIDAGARVATHLFNAMQPLQHRSPGPIAALLSDDRVTVELVLDGVHLHPALYRLVAAAADPRRISLVTDAMAAAGMADGSYRLGNLAVTVADGVARITGTDTIAGSTATMDQLFRAAVRDSSLPNDQALLAAALHTASSPAKTLGLTDVGRIAPRYRADLVVMDNQLRLVAVMHRGTWIRSS